MNQEDCYRKMFLALSTEVSDTIQRKQEAQQKVEECYIRFNELELAPPPLNNSENKA